MNREWTVQAVEFVTNPIACLNIMSLITDVVTNNKWQKDAQRIS